MRTRESLGQLSHEIFKNIRVLWINFHSLKSFLVCLFARLLFRLVLFPLRWWQWNENAVKYERRDMNGLKIFICCSRSSFIPGLEECLCDSWDVSNSFLLFSSCCRVLVSYFSGMSARYDYDVLHVIMRAQCHSKESHKAEEKTTEWVRAQQRMNK